MRTVLEFERGSEPEHRRVFKSLSGKWRRRPYGAAARVDDVLEVWLYKVSFKLVYALGYRGLEQC
jgi:hypothetical protein